MTTLIEYICEPLNFINGKPVRAQLRRVVWEDGKKVEDEPVGSPAAYETVRKHERTLRLSGAKS